MRGVLLPVFPGGLSALGILRADVVREFSRTVLLAATAAPATRKRSTAVFCELEREARQSLREQGFAPGKIRLERRFDMRYVGQAYELNVPAIGDPVAAFHRIHEQRFGYHDAARAVEIVNLRCRATGLTDKPGLAKIARCSHFVRRAQSPTGSVLSCIFAGKRESARLIRRQELSAGDTFAGPAVISEYSATSLVPRGWAAEVDPYGQILLRQSGKTRRHADKA
jgi:N-methylhydantoinase A